MLETPEWLGALDDIVPTEIEEVPKELGMLDGGEDDVGTLGMIDDTVEGGAAEEVVGERLVTDVAGLLTEGDGVEL